ncbi:MAG: superoxide dismutase family protein [Hyphomicrobiaceae bacterium]|nr:superoxide dismutase family protein [Hyphomicrobiaceae bacterium]
MRIAALLAALTLTAGAASAQVVTHEASLVNNKGQALGSAKLSGSAGGTVIRLQLKAGSLTPGWHGIHLHAVGDCSDHAGFQASKGHVNHGQKPHGLLHPQGPDEGDLPNIFANADGSVNAEVSTRTPMTGANGIKDGDGSALVIHASADDHTTQPIGGAGARVACGVIK